MSQRDSDTTVSDDPLPANPTTTIGRFIADQSPPVRAGIDAYRRAINARKDWHRAVAAACEAAIEVSKR